MANMVRRNPGSEVTSARVWDPFQIMTEMLGYDPFRAEGGRSALAEVWNPQFEVKEVKDGYLIQADVPGIDEKDLDMSLVGNRLTISGQRTAEERKEGERYFTYERSYGSFTRSFTLPEGVNTDDVDAQMANGVLTIRLPKKTEAQPRKIGLKGAVEKMKGSLGLGGKEKGTT